MKKFVVYCLYDIRTNLIFYVGSTFRDIKYRMIEHKKPSRKESSSLKIQELGRDNVNYAVVEYCDCYDDMFDREYYWTNYYSKFFKLVNKDIGKFHGESFHKKMDGVNNPNYGKKLSDEAKAKLRAWALAHPLSEEDKLKAIVSRTGKPCSELRRQAISRALREKYAKTPMTYNNVSVRCLTTNEEFDSIKAASKKYNVPASGISAVCRHKRKTYGKFEGKPLIWEYIDK